MKKSVAIIGLIAGMICGLAAYHTALKLGDFTLINRQTLEQQRSIVIELQRTIRDTHEFYSEN